MKLSIAIFFFLCSTLLSGQEHSDSIQKNQLTTEALVGNWKVESSSHENMRKYSFIYKNTGIVEMIYHCNGPCEGQKDSIYVDEVGAWTLENDSIMHQIYYDAGATKEIVQTFYFEVLSIKEKDLTLKWISKGEVVSFVCKRE